MGRILTSFAAVAAILVATILCVLRAEAQTVRKTGVLIFPIRVRGIDLTAADLEDLKSYLGTRLTIENAYSPMPEEVIRKDLGAAKLRSYAECYDDYCRIELGRAVFADKSLSVEITEVGGFCSITAKLFDIKQEIPEAAGDWSTSCAKADIRAGMAVVAAQLSGTADYSGRARKADSTVAAPTGSEQPVNLEDPEVMKWYRGLSNPVPKREAPPKEPSPTRNEGFAFRIGGGGYGGLLDFSVSTIRWKYFVWEVFRFGGAGVGPGLDTGSTIGWMIYVGTAFGVPIHLDSRFRHELRVMTGLFGGWIGQNRTVGYENVTDESYGPFVMVETSYVFHYSWNHAFQTGLHFMVPTLGYDGKLPEAGISGFVGFRF